MKLVRELNHILNGGEKARGMLLLCGLAFGAVLEIIGIGLIVPFIGLLNRPDLILSSPVAQPFISVLGLRDGNSALLALGSGLIGIFVARSIFVVLLFRWLFRYAFAVQVRLGNRLLVEYLKAPYAFHLSRNSSELIKSITGTVHGFASGFIINLLNALGECLVLAAWISLFAVLEPILTMGLALVLGAVGLIGYRTMQHRLATAGLDAEKSFGLIIQSAEQALGGVKETLVSGTTPFFIERYDHCMRRLAKNLYIVAFFSVIPRQVLETLVAVIIIAGCLAILLRSHNIEAVLPLLGIFAVAAVRIVPSISRIATALTQLRYHYATVEIIYSELGSVGRSRMMEDTNTSSLLSPITFDQSVQLDRISFRYPSKSNLALEDVSLEIPKGNWIAFIGPTGAGKTTLLDIILGLFTPTSGRILIDGAELSRNVGAWQRIIGLVTQDVYLMDDSVRHNVAFGVPNEQIDDERVWSALRAAELDRVVDSLPGKLDAIVGERGRRISGGERQRLGIARAHYRDSQVLVVDEGTANLDSETEAAIERSLARLRGQKTIIVVAHRLNLIRRCDRIFLFKEGRLQRSGSYSEILDHIKMSSSRLQIG
jgi:ATP-binding cassette subfamily C protein